jgi:hypothetical protein
LNFFFFFEAKIGGKSGTRTPCRRQQGLTADFAHGENSPNREAQTAGTERN